jgi:hypothetical protein
VTDGVTVMSLSASLLQKISVATGHLCQIVLNWKLSQKFKKWYEFSRHMKVKTYKRNHLKWDLPICVIVICRFISIISLCIYGYCIYKNSSWNMNQVP